MHLNTRIHDSNQAASSFVPLIVTSAVATETPPRGWRSFVIPLGHFLFGYRDYLFPLVFLVLVLTTTPELPFGSARLDHWLDFVGLTVSMLGQGCRILTVGSVDNIRRRGDRKHIAAQSLIRHGIFAHVRNPLYLGNILIIAGLVLIANCRWWYFLVLPGFAGVYMAIVLAEEEFLRQRFGRDYSEYAQAVNRFVPTVRGLYQSLTTCSFSWRRALRKESGVLCTWLFAALVLFVWQRWTHVGVTTWTIGISQLLLVLLLTILTYRGVLWSRVWEKKHS